MKRIPLTKGLEALIDDEDYEELSEYKWFASEVSPGKIYAATNRKRDGKWRLMYMHRWLLGAKKGQYVDHIDGDGLNNQTSNIRICTHAQNISNRKGAQSNNKSGFIGVDWHIRRKKWRAQIASNGKKYSIGYFDTAEEAARARDMKAIELHGPFACLNFKETPS